MKKVLEFQAKIDSAEFNKELEGMQRKLKEIYAPADQIRSQQLLNQRAGQILPGQGMGGAGNNTQQAYRSATANSDQKFRQMLMEEMQGLEKKKKLLEEHGKTMERHQRAYEETVKAGREDLELQKKVTQEMEKHKKLQEEIANKTEVLNQATKGYIDNQPKGRGQQLAESFSKGGASGLVKKGVEMAGGAEAMLLMGVAGAAVYALKTAVNVAENMAREFSAMRRVTSTAQAGAISGSAGQYLSNMYGGRGVIETGYAGERATALQRALAEDKVTRGVESMKAGDFGSMNQIMDQGTMGPGARLGAGALFSLFSGDQQRARFFGSLGHEGSQKKYEALKAQELISNYQENFEAEKAKDPLKMMAIENFGATHMRDLGVQRRIGLTDQALYGQKVTPGSSADRYSDAVRNRQRGFYEDVTGSGFMTEQGVAAMGDIMNSGGSTRAGRDATSALKFSRGLDLTNASQIFGNLSGTMGDANKSKNAMIEILAEGTRLGLNKSEFVEEQRKFAEATASFISRGYGGTDADSARMAEMFSGGVVNKTTAGIGAAAQAMDYYSQVSGTATGAEGSLGFASLMSDPSTKGLGAIDLQALNAMKTEDVTTTNPQIRAMAAKTGKTPQEIVDAKNRSDRGKHFRSGEMQNRASALGEKLQASGFTSMQEVTDAADSGDENAKALENEFGSISNYLQNTSGLNDSKVNQANALRLMGGFGAGGKDEAKKSIWEKFAGGTGRATDAMVAGQASQEGFVLEKTQGMLEDFTRMAEVTKSMSSEMVNAMLKIQQVIKDIDNAKSDETKEKMYKTVNESIDVFRRAADGVRPGSAGTQPQTGKK